MTTWDHYKGAAEAAAAQGDHATAEAMWTHALTFLEQTGQQDPKFALALDGLGKAYASQKRYSQAELTYARAIKLKEQLFGPVSIEVAKTCNLLAAIFYEQAKWNQTESLGQRALQIYQSTLGHEHPAVATMANNLARVRKKLEKAMQQSAPAQTANVAHGAASAQAPNGGYAQTAVQTGQALPGSQASAGAAAPQVESQPADKKNDVSRMKAEQVCEVCGRQYTGPDCLQCTQSLAPIDFGMDALNPKKRDDRK